MDAEGGRFTTVKLDNIAYKTLELRIGKILFKMMIFAWFKIPPRDIFDVH